MIAGGLSLSSTPVVAAGVADLPDSELDPAADSEEDWYAHRADAGNRSFVEDGYEFDGERLEVAWTVDHDWDTGIAVANETVYLNRGGGIAAVDAQDGSEVWEHEEITASQPTVVYDTVFVTGGEVFALDQASGEVRWQTDFQPEESIGAPTVAYDGVYVVVDGWLYALEAADGDVRWVIPCIDTRPFSRSAAAANGVVYATSLDHLHAIEPETGEEVWRVEREIYSSFLGEEITVNDHTLVVDMSPAEEVAVHDPITGEHQYTPFSRAKVTLNEDVLVTHSDLELGVLEAETGEELWSVDSAYNASPGAISGETLYTYFEETTEDWAEYDGALVAFDTESGTEQWRISVDDAPVGTIRAISGNPLHLP